MYINIAWVVPLFFGYHSVEPSIEKVEVDETVGDHLGEEVELAPKEDEESPPKVEDEQAEEEQGEEGEAE